MKYFAKKEAIRKYYKYVDTPWTQPVLASDGTLGVGEFSVNGSPHGEGSTATWYAFDGNTSTAYASGKFGTSITLIMWFEEPLLVSDIDIITQYRKADISISLDNINYTTIGTFAGDGTNLHADLSSTEFCHYVKMIIYGVGETDHWPLGAIAEVNVIAQKRVIEEATIDDYDFYKDEDVYSAFNI